MGAGVRRFVLTALTETLTILPLDIHPQFRTLQQDKISQGGGSMTTRRVLFSVPNLAAVFLIGLLRLRG
jgi:hypothetical protein